MRFPNNDMNRPENKSAMLPNMTFTSPADKMSKYCSNSHFNNSSKMELSGNKFARSNK